MSVADAAKSFYERQLRESLESTHMGQFVAIEPRSGRYFIAESFVEAAMLAKDAVGRASVFVVRIGHEAAVHIGAYTT